MIPINIFIANLIIIIVCLSVDLMLIMGTNSGVINVIKPFLSSKFDMKVMIKTNLILGIRLMKLKAKNISRTLN